MHDRATDSNRRSISGATRVKAWLQKLYRGFLISSIKVMSRPQGCGLRAVVRAAAAVSGERWRWRLPARHCSNPPHLLYRPLAC